VTISRLQDGDGKRVGTGYLSCGVTRRARNTEGAIFQCSGTHKLRDGTLKLSGVAKLATARVITVAVTGGTGAYAGASGELVKTATIDNTSTRVITLK
jgi:hypothetical protein